MKSINQVKKYLFDDLNIFLIVTSSFVATVGRGITLPFLPLYLHNQLQMNILDTGSVLTLAMVSGMLISLPVGKLASHYSHKMLLITSLIVFMAAFLLLVWIPSVVVFIVSFTLINSAYSVYSTIVKCFISEHYADKDKTRYFSLNYTFVNIGWMVGPLLGTWLAGKDILMPFYLSSLTGGVALVLTAKLSLSNSSHEMAARGENGLKINTHTSAYRLLLIFTAGIFLSSFVFGRFASCISQVLMTEYDSRTTGNIISLLMATNAATVIFFQYVTGIFIGRISKSVGFLCGALCLIVGLLFFCKAGSNPVLWGTGMVFFSFGEIIFMPLQYGVIDMIAPPGSRALYFSFQNLGGIGGAVNPALTGLLLTVYSGSSVYLTLIAASLLAFIIFAAGIRMSGQQRD